MNAQPASTLVRSNQTIRSLSTFSSRRIWLTVLVTGVVLVAGTVDISASTMLPQTQQRATSQQTNAQLDHQQRQIETLAVVNDQPITRQQIADECMRRFGKEVLQEIVNKFLVNEELKKKNIVLTEQDVIEEIANEARKLGWTSERWLEVISTNRNLTIDRIKNDYVWNKLALRTLVADQIQVSRRELEEQMAFEFGSKVQVRQIVVDNNELALQLIAAVRQNPDEFERLAKKHSIDPNSASMGGLLQPIRRFSGFDEFEQIAFSLQPGQVSEPIEVADKWIVLRCERIIPGEQIPPEQQLAIEERLAAEISNSKMGDAAVELFEKIQRDAQIVNVLNDPQLSQQHPGVAMIVNGTKVPYRYVAEECIARYGQEMLKTEINRSLLKAELQKNGLQVAKDDIQEEIVSAARSMYYVSGQGEVDIDAWLNEATGGDLNKMDFYIEDEVWPSVALKKLVEQDIMVTPEDMQKGFEANFGPRAEVLVIMTDNDRQAAKIWEMAAKNRTREFFGKLANQYSIEPASKNNFGQVPPIQKHGGRPELEKEAFSLKPGEISKTIQVGQYKVIMYCLGFTEPVVADFDAVKQDIHDNIYEKKLRLAMYDKFQQVTEEAQIDNYLTGTSQTGKARVREARNAGSTQRPGRNR